MAAEMIAKQYDLGNKIKNAWVNITKRGKGKATPGCLRQRLQVLRDDWDTFQKVHNSIMELPEAERESYNVLLEDVEDFFCVCAGNIDDVLNPPRPTPTEQATLTTVAPTGPPSTTSLTKLARVDIPVFSGDALDWPKFKGLFESLIHNNNEVPKIVKYQHLVSHLKGEAAELIENEAISDEGYDAAWKDLVEQYENEHVLLFEYMRNLVTCPAVARASAAELKRVSAVARRSQRAFKALKRPVDQWSDWLLFLTVEKLDAASKLQWQSNQPAGNKIPTFTSLLEFLDNRIHGLSVSKDSGASQGKDRKQNSGNKSTPKATLTCHAATSASEKPAPMCSLCSQNHTLSFCFKFKKLNHSQRVEHVRKSNACYNCLHSGHRSSQCPSKVRCRRDGCNELHHTLLHQDGQPPASAAPSVSSAPIATSGQSESVKNMVSTSLQTTAEATHTMATGTKSATVLLATAMVTLATQDGRCTTVRALLDPASESSFITERVAQTLHVNRAQVTVPVVGLQGSSTAIARYRSSVILKSPKAKNFTLSFSALILPQLSSALPSRHVYAADWAHITGLELADPNFASPARIDALLGADVYGPLITGGVHWGQVNQPVALQTVFGWVLLGPASQRESDPSAVTSLHCRCEEDIGSQLRRLWELEEVSSKTPLTKEDEWCEQHFASTHSRAEDGRYVVRLALRPDEEVRLGESRRRAQQMFMATERKLRKDPALAERYIAFMLEYLTLAHMQAVELSRRDSNENYYMPHHAVFHPTSGKIRVVFNASSPSSSGASLNDKLVPGPRLQPDLWIIITAWRLFRVPFTTDIVKMYRQINMHQNDRRYLRILWRSNPQEPLQDYAMTTVTYGTSSAPHDALRSLAQLAEDEHHRYPDGARVIRKNTYIDDVYAGADDVEAASKLKDEVTAIFKAGQFPLDKWASTHAVLCPGGGTDIIDLPEFESVSTLGLRWNPRTDFFTLKVEDPPSPDASSKRQVLSAIAKLFDPLGWVSPVVITSKILLQDLWLAKISWDDPLPLSARQVWKQFCAQFPDLREVEIPRWVSFIKAEQHKAELHGFADASQRAYAACVYLRIAQGDNIRVNLLVAKTKVAPVKAQTVPRLELCAAQLLTKLLNKVKVDLEFNDTPTFAWTDSQVVLAWLRGHATKWPPFVAHRVAEIQSLMPVDSWRYVHTKTNPADLATRGLSPKDLIQADLWWHGPQWLQQPRQVWPTHTENAALVSCLLAAQSPTEPQSESAPGSEDISTRFSSLRKLLLVAAIFLRTRQPQLRGARFVRAEERSQALQRLITQAQHTVFQAEINCVRRNENLPRNSALKHLRPFLDDNGLLRVGGRLQQSTLPFDQRHPVILPKDAHLTMLLIRDAHLRTLHGGPQLVRCWIKPTGSSKATVRSESLFGRACDARGSADAPCNK